jgi:hypothetical protein
MGASSSQTLQPKNIDEMLAGLKKAAKSDGFDIKGDKKSGKSGAKEGGSVEYVVKGQDVTVTVNTGVDLATMERYMKDWLKPYK